MSSISLVDSKQSNSMEILNIPEVSEVSEVSEVIDVNNFREVQPLKTNDEDNGVVENIKLDKTNIETYMNDIKKNFYKIQFSQTILEDICELHCKNNETSNAKDFINNSYEEYKLTNKVTDVNRIQPVPMGIRRLSSSSNDYSLNVINNSSSLVKSTMNIREKDAVPEMPEIACAGFSYGPNYEFTFPSFTTNWTTRAVEKTVPMSLSLSIPGFVITSGDIKNLGFLDKGIDILGSCQKDAGKSVIIPGYSCGTYKDRCHKPLIGWHDCWKFNGKKDQVVYRKIKYTKKPLVTFSEFGVKFEGSFTNRVYVKFELETNIPVQVIINIISKVDIKKHEFIKGENTVKKLMTRLREIFTFQNILEIMIFAYAYCVENDYVSPYVDFIITSVKVYIDFTVSTFSVNYGSFKKNFGGFNFDKWVEGLTDGKYITFSVNPRLGEIEANFTFFEGTLSDLLLKQASPRALQYALFLLKKFAFMSGNRGLFFIAVLIICEKYFRLQDELQSVSSGQVLEYHKSLIRQITYLETQLYDIIDVIDKLSIVEIGGLASVINNIIEKIEPTITLSVGVCAGISMPAVLIGCGSISLPEIDIKQYLKQALTAMGNTIPRIQLADKISDKFINSVPKALRFILNDYNSALEEAETSIRNGYMLSVEKTFDLLDDAKLGLVASPSVDLCVPL